MYFSEHLRRVICVDICDDIYVLYALSVLSLMCLLIIILSQDRCHRIGQTKAVTVYKLVTGDSVDEDIYEMGERKRKLSTAVLSDDRQNNAYTPDAKSKGKKKGHDQNEEDEMDIGAIGRILQRALLRVTGAK